MTPELQQAIVDEHNELRNEFALGKTPHYDTAARMATMTWVPELVELAEIHARNCKFEHNKCRATGMMILLGGFLI